MNEELLSLIEASGFKKKHIAEQLGITPTYLSMCIAGTRELSRKKERKLLDLLSPTLKTA
jgi:predicted transcriptional regulator